MNPIQRIVGALSQEFGLSNHPLEENEEMFANELKDVLHRVLRDQTFAKNVYLLLSAVNANESFCFEDVLEFYGDEDREHDPDYCDESAYEEVENESVPIIAESWIFHGVQFSRIDVEAALAYYRSTTTKRNMSESSMRSRFPAMIQGPSDIGRLRDYEKAKQRFDMAVSTKRAHLAGVSQKAYERFKEAENQLLPIHDREIRTWALEAHRELGSPIRFVASQSWINTFKSIHGITSRRVTHWIGRQSVQTAQTPSDVAKEFLSKMRPIINIYPTSRIFNMDQSGFYYESHSNRSLATKGVKNVERVVANAGDAKKKLTIMPIVSADGRLLPLLFVQIAQTRGAFPPNAHVFEAPNLHAVAGTSHIMTTATCLDFFQNCLMPYLEQGDSLILLDGWRTFGSDEVVELLGSDPEKQIAVQRIPEHTTSICQPLDLYFFRPWKGFAKTMDDYALLYNIPCNMTKRDRELKRHSLIHNQFSHPRFQNLIRYAWHKAGYFDAHPGQFVTPVDFCFPKELPSLICQNDNCDLETFIRCAHCEKVLCWDCFFVDFHFHNVD